MHPVAVRVLVKRKRLPDTDDVLLETQPRRNHPPAPSVALVCGLFLQCQVSCFRDQESHGHHLLRYGTDKLPRLVKEVVDRRRSIGMLGNDLIHGHVVGRATGRDQSNATTLLLLLIAKHPCRIIGLVLCRESRRHRRSGKQGTRHEACGIVRVHQEASPIVVVLLNLILDGRHRTLAKILSHHWLHNLSGNKQSFLQGTPGPQQLPTERRILTRPSGQPWGQLPELPSLQGIPARSPPPSCGACPAPASAMQRPCSTWLRGALARQPRRSGWHVRAVRTVGRRP